MRVYNSVKQMALYQFRSMFRNKTAVFFCLMMPLIFLTIFGFMYRETGVSRAEIGWIDRDGGAAARTLRQVVDQADQYAVLTDDEALAEIVNLNVFDYLMPGQLASMLLSAGLVTVAMSLSQQRQTGVLRHLFSTPLSMGVWMGARVAANMLMAALQVAVLYGAAFAMFQVHGPANIAGTALVLTLSTLVTLSMGLLVGVLVRSPDTAMPVAMILYMASLFLGGSMMPLDFGPVILQNIARFMPSYYMTHALRLVMMQGKGLGAVAFDIVVLVGCAAVGLGLASWRMRKQFVTA